MRRVRYTITVEDGAWKEVDHYSRHDGETWHPSFEMRLARDGG